MAEPMQSSIVRFGLGLGGFIVLVSAPISGYFLTQIFLEARASEDWPSVAGQLSKARVGKTSVGRFYPDVSYSYEVDGRAYTGLRVRASDGEYNFRDGAAQAIHGLHEGQRITVYYNPTEPSDSVLHTGAGFQEYALLGVPVIMLVMGVLAFVRLWRMRPAR